MVPGASVTAIKPDHVSSVPLLRLHLCLFGFVFLAHAAMVPFIRYPTAMYDELVYLGFARYFAGAAPMANAYNGAYGHFGYSVAIAPIYWLFGTFPGQFRAVLLLNGLLMAASYFPLYYVFKALSPASCRVLAFVSAVACLYPSFLLFSNYAISENLFVPLYLTVAALLVNAGLRPRLLNSIALGAAAGFLYIAHNRGIGVSIAVIVFVVILAACRKMPVALCAVVALLVCAEIVGMNYAKAQINQWFPNIVFPGKASWPDLHADGALKLWMLAFLGQIIYLAISTFGLYALGIVYIVRRARKNFQTGNFIAGLTASFLLVSHLAILTGSAYFVSGQSPLTRIDFLFIGRYNEGVLAPLIAGGLIFAYDSRKGGELRTLLRRCADVACVLLSICMAVLSRYIAVGPEVLASSPLRINSIGFFGLEMLTGSHEVSALCIVSIVVLMAWTRLIRETVRVSYGLIALIFLGSAFGPFWFWSVPGQQLSAYNGRSHTVARLVPLLEQTGSKEIGYDSSAWDAFFFAQYQLYRPEVVFTVLDPALGDKPIPPIMIAGRAWKQARELGFTAVGSEVLADQTLWVRNPELARRLVGAQSYMQFEIGNRIVPGVTTSNIDPEEGSPEGPFRWTTGNAEIRVPLQEGDRATRLDVRLSTYWPGSLSIAVNGKAGVTENLKAGESAFSLPVTLRAHDKALVIDIVSSMHRPEPVNGYTRNLGVQIRSIALR